MYLDRGHHHKHHDSLHHAMLLPSDRQMIENIHENYHMQQMQLAAAAANPLASHEDNELFRSGATVRERNRMHILNDAFEELRHIVPKTSLSEHQRLSKIATLRLAIHYISALTNILMQTGGCEPVDASLLPAPPRRRRRRRKIMLQQQQTGGVVVQGKGTMMITQQQQQTTIETKLTTATRSGEGKKRKRATGATSSQKKD